MSESHAISGGATLSSADALDTYIRPITAIPGKDQRHSGNVNMLFADFHIGTFTWKDLDRDTPAEKTRIENWWVLIK
jgi:prepilin-type processing-associated H-X9-DG protein